MEDSMRLERQVKRSGKEWENKPFVLQELFSFVLFQNIFFCVQQKKKIHTGLE